MSKSILVAVFFAVCLAPLPAPAQEPSSPVPETPAASDSSSRQPAPPQTQQEKDELRARIRMATKHYAEAADLYQRLAKQYPRNPAYLNFSGIARMQMGDLNGARKLFQRTTKVDKTFADGFNNLGTVWFSKRNYKKAIREYRKAIKLRPDVAGYYTNLGYAYFNRKKLPEAFAAFRQALLLDPGILERTGRGGPILQDRSVSDHGLFNFMMARTYAQLGDGPRCAVYLRKAFDEGYKGLGKKVRSDSAFAGVLSHPEVKTVLDQIAPPAPRPS